MKRVLFISSLYPNPLHPNSASFNFQQINSLSSYFNIDVVAPVPCTDRYIKRIIPTNRTEHMLSICHPTFFYTPKLFRNYYGYFYYGSILSTVKELIRAKEYALIYSSWLYPDSWAALQVAEKYRLPIIVKVHGTDVNKLVPGNNTLVRNSMNAIKQVNKVICVSDALKQRLIYLGAEPSKLEVIYNGVNKNIFMKLDRKKTRLKLGMPSNEKIILFVGNLKLDKGVRELVTAFKEFLIYNDSYKLVLIGNGPAKNIVINLIKSLSITDSTIMIDSMNLNDIALWMNISSMLCLPSYMEGVPNVVLEALSCGIRVIASSVGGIPELDFGDGQLTLIPPKDVKSLVAAMITVANDHNDIYDPNKISSWDDNARQLSKIISEYI